MLEDADNLSVDVIAAITNSTRLLEVVDVCDEVRLSGGGLESLTHVFQLNNILHHALQ